MSISRSDATTQLNASLAILNGDIANSIAPAISNINEWSQLLKIEGNAAFNTIAADLQALQGHLNGSDAAPISSTLLTLAEHVNSIDDDASPIFIEQLQQLAQRLSDIARDLQATQTQDQ
jgi:hypothetical protein